MPTKKTTKKTTVKPKAKKTTVKPKAKKTTVKPKAKKVVKNSISLEELFAGIEEHKETITLEELFADIDLSEPKTTPAYSTIIHSADANPEFTGARELFEVEAGEFLHKMSWFQRLAVSLMVGALALVIGGAWFELTSAYFSAQHEDVVVESVKTNEAINKNIDALNETKNKIQDIVSQAEVEQKKQEILQELQEELLQQ
jgi:hypothetical protein